MSATIPVFLHGCFDWRENGYFWNEPPPPGFSWNQALDSDNPWIALAAVVEHAKQGDHRHAHRLERFFHAAEPFALARVSLLVYADLAPMQELGRLERALRHSDARIRAHAAEATALTGQLSLVPAMVEARERATTLGDHETIGFAVSDILDDDDGTIREEVGVYPPPPSAPDAPPEVLAAMAKLREAFAEEGGPPFIAAVSTQLSEMQARVQPGTQVWAGEPMVLERLAEQLLDTAKSHTPRPMIDLRHRFEAMTGENCRDFFYAMAPQKLSIAAHVEEFLAARKHAQFQPGIRYFFGHPVP